MKKKILLIAIIVGIIVAAASVLIGLSFVYPIRANIVIVGIIVAAASVLIGLYFVYPILPIPVIVGIIVAASVLIGLSFVYPEEITEMSISGTLYPDKAEYYDLGDLKYNSEVGIEIYINGDYRGKTSVELVNVDNNRLVGGFYWFSHAKGYFGPFLGDHFTLRIEVEGEGDYPLSYNGTISITQHGVW